MEDNGGLIDGKQAVFVNTPRKPVSFLLRKGNERKKSGLRLRV